MYPTTGYTRDLTDAEKRVNELATLRDMLIENPDNQWAIDRMNDLQVIEDVAEFPAEWIAQAENHLKEKMEKNTKSAWLASTDFEADVNMAQADHADLLATQEGAR